MRLLVLGGTHFLGRHVATAALERGHDVATFTRGVSGAPPEGAPGAARRPRRPATRCPQALDGWAPELVVDTSCQTRAAARNAAAALADVRGYAFVSSLNAYRELAARARSAPRTTSRPGPPTTTSTARTRRSRERVLGASVGDRFLTARAGLIVGPYDPIYRLGWWLDRIAGGGRVVVRRGPGPADRRSSTPGTSPAGWSRRPSRAGPAAVNATGPDRHDDARRPARRCAARSPAATPSGCRSRRRTCSRPASSRGCTCRCGCPRRMARTGLGRRHHPRPRAGAAQPPAAGVRRRHLGLAAGADRPRRRRTGRGARPAARPGGPAPRRYLRKPIQARPSVLQDVVPDGRATRSRHRARTAPRRSSCAIRKPLVNAAGSA